MKGVPIHYVEIKRFLTDQEAATYAGMSIAEFRRDCPVRPQCRAQGRKVWDVSELDKWLDGYSSKGNSLIEEAISRL